MMEIKKIRLSLINKNYGITFFAFLSLSLSSCFTPPLDPLKNSITPNSTFSSSQDFKSRSEINNDKKELAKYLVPDLQKFSTRDRVGFLVKNSPVISYDINLATTALLRDPAGDVSQSADVVGFDLGPDSFLISNFNIQDILEYETNPDGSYLLDQNGAKIVKNESNINEKASSKSYTLIVNVKNPDLPEIISKISIGGMEIHQTCVADIMSADGSSVKTLFLAGNDSSGGKNPGIEKSALVISYNINNPEIPVFLKSTYLVGRVATSIAAAGQNNIIAGSGQGGEAYLLDGSTLEIKNSFTPLNGDIKSVAFESQTGIISFLDGPYHDNVLINDSAKIYTIDTLNSNTRNYFPVSPGPDGLENIMSSRAKSRITVLNGKNNGMNKSLTIALALASGGLEIRDAISGALLAGAIVSGKVLNDISNFNWPGLSENEYLLAGAVGYRGAEFFYLNTATSPVTLTGLGSVEFWKRDPALPTNRDGGGSTNKVLFYKIPEKADGRSASYIAAIANGVNGLRITKLELLKNGIIQSLKDTSGSGTGVL